MSSIHTVADCGEHHALVRDFMTAGLDRPQIVALAGRMIRTEHWQPGIGSQLSRAGHIVLMPFQSGRHSDDGERGFNDLQARRLELADWLVVYAPDGVLTERDHAEVRHMEQLAGGRRVLILAPGSTAGTCPTCDQARSMVCDNIWHDITIPPTSSLGLDAIDWSSDSITATLTVDDSEITTVRGRLSYTENDAEWVTRERLDDATARGDRWRRRARRWRKEAKATRTMLDQGVAAEAALRTEIASHARPPGGYSLAMDLRVDPPKMLREAVCFAQTWAADATARDRIGRLIAAIDVHRPLGPDGNHGSRHTATCGCWDKPEVFEPAAVAEHLEHMRERMRQRLDGITECPTCSWLGGSEAMTTSQLACKHPWHRLGPNPAAPIPMATALPPCGACQPGCPSRHDRHRDAADPRGAMNRSDMGRVGPSWCYQCFCPGYQPEQHAGQRCPTCGSRDRRNPWRLRGEGDVVVGALCDDRWHKANAVMVGAGEIKVVHDEVNGTRVTIDGQTYLQGLFSPAYMERMRADLAEAQEAAATNAGRVRKLQAALDDMTANRNQATENGDHWHRNWVTSTKAMGVVTAELVKADSALDRVRELHTSNDVGDCLGGCRDEDGCRIEHQHCDTIRAIEDRLPHLVPKLEMCPTCNSRVKNLRLRTDGDTGMACPNDWHES